MIGSSIDGGGNCRERRLEEQEQAVKKEQADTAGLKAELQQLADSMRAQAEQQVAAIAEDKLTLSRQQARLDTLQVSLP